MYTVDNLGISDKQWDGEQWIVTEETGIPDTEDRSQLNRAWFTGPDAGQRAREYAEWKNGARK